MRITFEALLAAGGLSFFLTSWFKSKTMPPEMDRRSSVAAAYLACLMWAVFAALWWGGL